MVDSHREVQKRILTKQRDNSKETSNMIKNLTINTPKRPKQVRSMSGTKRGKTSSTAPPGHDSYISQVTGHEM